MIKPKFIERKSAVEIQSIFNMFEKGRFLRLLDLSLRSPVLPTQLIASFLKRLGRTVASYGACFTTQDIMFVLAFSNNLVKRHPKTMRLIHRRSVAKDLHVELMSDPYKEDEEDPL
jgi:U3 small nucleolar RNA-associated protein 19